MDGLIKLGNGIMKTLEVLVVVILSAMSILVIVNVALRFLLSSSIVVSEELSRFMFIYVVMIGAIIAMKEDAHIYVDFIAKKFPRPIQFFLRLFVELAMLYCCIVFCQGSITLSEYNMVDKSPVAGIPLGYIYFSGAIGAFGMAVVIVIRIIKHIKNANSFFGPDSKKEEVTDKGEVMKESHNTQATEEMK